MAQFAFCGDPNKLIRNQADTFLHPRLFRLPCATAKLIKQTLIMAIAAEKFDIFNRQEQTIPACIFKRQTFMRGACGGDGFKPLKPPDAVINMHHQITR